MKRERIVRGKRVDNDEWAIGFYIELANPQTGEQESFIQTVKKDGRADALVKVIPETVGQYTGLTDKNRKVNRQTGEVFDIEVAEDADAFVSVLDKEFVRLADGTEHPVVPGENDGSFWCVVDEELFKNAEEPSYGGTAEQNDKAGRPADLAGKSREALGLFYTADPKDPASECFITEHGLYLNARGTEYIRIGNKKYRQIELLGQQALFTKDKITLTDIPQGLYCYHLRKLDDGSFYTLIDAYALADFGGSVITNKPFADLAEKWGVFLTEDTQPQFTGKFLTMREYMSFSQKKGK